MKPRKLDIFMLRQFLLLFVGAFFICLFVLMMQFLWRYVDDLIGKGLTLDVLARFFWYMGLMMVPQALPLAILLSSLITMGNLGESSELTAIKAAGIPLIKALRGLIAASVVIACCSFVFQNNVGSAAKRHLNDLLWAMKQKSPELEIPEEIFYNGIPNCNLYVQHKDLESGKLYGIMIYRMTDTFDDAAIILADSGMMQSTADKKHLKLTLQSGEWFENLKQEDTGGQASVPYRRESFVDKVIILNFDDGLNEESSSTDANANSVKQLSVLVDSIHAVTDSTGHAVARDMNAVVFNSPHISKKDSLKLTAMGTEQKINFDTVFAHLSPEMQRDVVQSARMAVERTKMDMEFRSMEASGRERLERVFKIEMVNKFTLSLTCIIFFFIGAPLGAIIRKGGLGVPIIVCVLVYILFFILDNTGFKMARQGSWTILFGKGLSPAVLIPLAVFVTYKANRDSMVFNVDAYRNFFISLLGLRFKRHVSSKEVIINSPDYKNDVVRLQQLTEQVEAYSHAHKLRSLPNPVAVFFRYTPDHEVEKMAAELEDILDDLGNTRDRYILYYINMYPLVSEKAHTRPFSRKWMNQAAGIFFPLGIILYIRMWRFRLRLYHDMRQIKKTNELMITRIGQMEI